MHFENERDSILDHGMNKLILRREALNGFTATNPTAVANSSTASLIESRQTCRSQHVVNIRCRKH